MKRAGRNDRPDLDTPKLTFYTQEILEWLKSPEKMNFKKLIQAEEAFFDRYPGGFARRKFKLPELIVENMIKVVTRSSRISVFEKPRFRNFARSLPPEDRKVLSQGLGEILHGDERTGFEMLLGILRNGKLARWSLMTICQAYYRPQVEVFVKPTTAKEIIETFELTNLHYKPSPTWAFYEMYRATINEMKTIVDPSLSAYNIAFTGFLMRSIHWQAGPWKKKQ